MLKLFDMKQAFFRVFLIVLPIIPILLILSTQKAENKESHLSQNPLQSVSKTKDSSQQQSPFFKSKSLNSKKVCAFSVSLAPQKPKEVINPKASFHSFIVPEDLFLKQAKLISREFKSYPSYLFLPIYLTKDNHWIVSWKSFVFLENLERHEISHLDYETIKKHFIKTQGQAPLTLQTIVKKLPKHSLFLQIDSLDEKKSLKHLEFLKNYKKPFYIFSSNEDLLKSVKSWEYARTIHALQKIIRMELLSFAKAKSFVSLYGNGVIIPDNFLLSKRTMLTLSKNEKLFFVQSQDPVRKIKSSWIPYANGLISSNLESMKQFISQNKICPMP